MAKKTLQRIIALVGRIKWSELYTLVLISFGLPYAVYIWSNIQAALAAFIVLQIALQLISIRGREA